jgi:dTDP-glucose 4,6-dehydratase
MNEIEILAGDITDRDSVRKVITGADIVFHLAALIGIPYSYHAPASYVHTNIEGTLNILQAALEDGVERVVQTSTSEVYGTARYVPIDEEHPLQGQSPYAASKIGADKLAEAFHLSFGLPIATIRPFNTYGPRQSARAIIPTIIVQGLTQQVVHLGNLEPLRDLTYVEDTVEGFIRIAQQPEAIGQVINIGSGQEFSVKDLAERIIRLTGRETPIISDETRKRPPASEVSRLYADNSKAGLILEWHPSTGLDEGLQKTLEWIKENIGRYRADEYGI